MAADIRSRLILDTREFEAGVTRGQQAVDRLDRDLKMLGVAAKSAATAFVSFSTATLALSRRQAALGARLQETSDKLGLGVQFLQRFRYAAEQSGVSVDTADMALQRFTRRVAEAAQGTGEARDALRQMGVALRDSNGELRPTEDILNDVSDALSLTEDSSERVRLAFKLFDSEGVALINTLQDGSDAMREMYREAERLGVVLTEQDTRQLKALDDSYTELSAAIKGVVDQFVLGLVPALLDVNDGMTDTIALNREVARELGAGVGESLRTVAAAARVLIDNIDAVRTAFITFIGINAARSIATLIARMASLTSNARSLGGVISGVGAAVSNWVRTLPIIGSIVNLLTTLTPVALAVKTAIFAAGAAFVYFRDTAIQVGQITATLSEIMAAVFSKIVELVSMAAVNLVEKFVSAFNTISTALAPFLEFFGTAMSSLLDSTIFVVNKMVGGFIVAFEIIKAGVTGLIDTFVATFNVISFSVLDFVDRAKDQFGQLFDYITSFGESDISNAFAGMFGGIGDKIDEEFRKIGNGDGIDIETIMGTDYVGQAMDFGKDVATNMVNGLEEILEEYREGNKLAEKIAPGGKIEIPVEVDEQGSADSVNGFLDGVKTAMETFKNRINDTAAYGARIFNTMANSFTDSILQFVETGKLSFKDLFKSLFTEIIKMQANRLFLNLFTMGMGAGGVLSNIFAGLFANGGMIPGGKIGIVGEAGPEFVAGPATVTSARDTAAMMGSRPTVVNYNIQAVDAASFRQLVARDPEFIYSVTQAGARRVSA